MAIVRVMFVGHGPSNLPEDRVINVFHFTHLSDYATAQPLCETAVATFYNGTSGQTNPISAYLSPWVQRDAEMRSYDLEQPEPRVPTVTPLTLSAVLNSQGGPEEACCCLSYHGAPPLTPRNRGRIYIGPLCTNAITMATATSPTRPANALIADLVAAGNTLSDNTVLDWVIRSLRPSLNYAVIFGGWVDNALDTQRRRGPDATARSTWENTP
jgi:hypothetical protein